MATTTGRSHDCQQFLEAPLVGVDDDQDALIVVLHPGLETDPFGPEMEMAPGGNPTLELCGFRMPLIRRSETDLAGLSRTPAVACRDRSDAGLNPVHAIKAVTSVSSACARRRCAPERKTAVKRSSEKDPGWRSSSTLFSLMAHPCPFGNRQNTPPSIHCVTHYRV